MIHNRAGRAILAMVPSVVLLYAYSTGPGTRFTGAPGDEPEACHMCHIGTPLDGGGGKVEVQFPNGLTYTSGVAQTLTVVVSDIAARVYGFQMTARLESNLANGQAGDFTAGAQQVVKCDNESPKGAAGCPASAAVQFIMHTAPFRTNSIQVSWTPPPTNAGNVHIYIAANAANASGNELGDHIYTANYVLTPAGTAAAPAIAAVVSATGFKPSAGLASGTWLEIYGSNFATPIEVTINNRPGLVVFSNATQINVQAPDDPSVGPGIPVQATAGGVKSNVFAMEKKAIAPAVLVPPLGSVKPGDIITFYGIGFGPVSPPVAAGTVAAGLTALQPAPVVRIGNATATLQYAGLAPGLIGLYQFNVVVPTVAPGEHALNVEIGGVSVNSGLVLAVGQ